MATQRMVVGISGASGVVYGLCLLEMLRALGVETHLVMSRTAQLTLAQETALKPEDVARLADHAYAPGDMAAAIASGSFRTLGMVVAPCSMRTLGEIASGVTTTLLARAADVALKERRRLVLMTRESPLHLGHLRNMAAATEMGAVIAPPMPAFYNAPATLEDMVHHSVGRVLDLFGLEAPNMRRWKESGG